MHRAPRNWREQIRSARTFTKRGSQRGLEILVSALRWRYDTARNEAVKTLASLGSRSVPLLLHILASAATAVERRSACDALGLMRNRRAVPFVLKALKDPNMVVRRSAAKALLSIRVPQAVPNIARLLRDESGGVRVLAANVLGKFGDPAPVPALIRALRDPKWYVRQAAAEALGRIGDRRALMALQRATRDSRPAVAQAARRAKRGLPRSTSKMPIVAGEP